MLIWEEPGTWLEIYARSSKNSVVRIGPARCTPPTRLSWRDAAAEEGHELVIAVGGDGTAHEVANGLMQVPQDRRPRMGIVPIGSGNDFSHAVGMDRSPYAALRQIFTGVPKPIDVGRLEDGHGRLEYWVNTLGIGFDATATIRSRRFTVVRGFLIYLLAVLQTIMWNHDAPLMQVETDEENWEERMLMLVLCNGPRERRRLPRPARGTPGRRCLPLCFGRESFTPDDAANITGSDAWHAWKDESCPDGKIQVVKIESRCAFVYPHGWRDLFRIWNRYPRSAG